VSFTQTLTGSGASPSAAPVNIEVRALTSFQQAGANTPIINYVTASGSCASCHVAGNPSLAPTKWVYTGDSLTTWQSLSPWAGKDFSGNTITDPSQAAVYTNPCTGTNGHPTVVASDQQCPTILQWVREGGHYN
jgi:mono/diheme cytochrome c family protein